MGEQYYLSVRICTISDQHSLSGLLATFCGAAGTE
uniref:Uncharacterized protein n=1 Tax=Anguilla anguilla TaxID=7936 RepID=A0A0E9U6P2_ANGAN